MKEITYRAGEDGAQVKAICEIASYLDSLDSGKEYIICVKERKKRRSLDANAYAWVLMDRIAERLHESKEAVYRGYIKQIGGNNTTVCVRSDALSDLREGWERNGLGWITESVRSRINGCTNVILYYGSSVYDSAQMSRLIDLIVQDCKALEIETRPEGEIEKLLEEWGLTTD